MALITVHAIVFHVPINYIIPHSALGFQCLRNSKNLLGWRMVKKKPWELTTGSTVETQKKSCLLSIRNNPLTVVLHLQWFHAWLMGFLGSVSLSSAIGSLKSWRKQFFCSYLFISFSQDPNLPVFLRFLILICDNKFCKKSEHELRLKLSYSNFSFLTSLLVLLYLWCNGWLGCPSS